MDYRDPETARRRSIFHQRIQIGFPGRSFVVDLQSYFSSLLGPVLPTNRGRSEGKVEAQMSRLRRDAKRLLD
ncbi:hypothetical protein DGN07_17145 [Xanthomonas citri pv. fuscans]|nr:hypothetical protein DGN07_17145 [Xanthomonas citri pv. fuscans]